MSGRRKGLVAEREVVRALRATWDEIGDEVPRAWRVERDRGAGPDVDVIALADDRAWLAQVKREEDPPLASYVRVLVGRRAVLIHRRNREPWAVYLRRADTEQDVDGCFEGVTAEVVRTDLATWARLVAAGGRGRRW